MLQYLIISFFALAAHADVELDRLLDEQMVVAREQNRSYWPQYLNDAGRICRLTKANASEVSECLQQVLETSKKVLGCERDADLWNEMSELDKKLSQDIFDQYPRTPIPDNIRNIFYELIGQAENLLAEARPNYSLPLAYLPPPRWTFTGYNAPVYNAQAGSSGGILISAAFWGEKNIFTEDEIRAVLAHEVAHVIHNHSLQMGCLAYEWAQGQHGLADSFAMLFEEIFPTGPRGEARTKLSQRNEFEADAYGKVLLRNLNHDPADMARALEKLLLASSSSSGGFSSGSHPDMEERIERARNK